MGVWSLKCRKLLITMSNNRYFLVKHYFDNIIVDFVTTCIYISPIPVITTPCVTNRYIVSCFQCFFFFFFFLNISI